MLVWLLQTDNSVAELILRPTLAVVMFPHGAQKMFGWFGDHCFKSTMQSFTSSGIPTGFALLAIAAEFLGPPVLAIGLLTRVAAFGIACIMLVAIVTMHGPHGFFVKWLGNQQGEGFEYYLLALGISIALIIMGGGVWSVERVSVRGAGL
jgi:putative oxidoreductase